MASFISSLLSRILGSSAQKEQGRALLLGPDAAGKTTLLYRLALPEQPPVTTIPTIGFNVETITLQGGSTALSADSKTKPETRTLAAWDVGGCDMIRPLWRHYFANTDIVLFIIDAADINPARLEEEKAQLAMLNDPQLQGIPVLIVANKMDLKGARSLGHLMNEFYKEPPLARGRDWNVVGVSALTGQGLEELSSWVVAHTGTKYSSRFPLPNSPNGDMKDNGVDAGQTTAEPKPMLLEWLEREDQPDDAFLESLANCTLDSWDHYTHLRIAWLHLTKFGRRPGLQMACDAIKSFIANSPRARKTTYHETMTYFWIHMVHFAIASTYNPTNDFKGFLATNPKLCNGGLYREYYSDKLMLHTAETRVQVALPDKKPLPSIVGKAVNLKGTALPN